MNIEEAIPLKDFAVEVAREMKYRDIIPSKNALIVYVGCSDDQSTYVLNKFLNNLYKELNFDGKVDENGRFIYERRVFGGIFIPEYHTYESLIPSAHHIPNRDEKEKYLFVLHLAHVGYHNRKYGEFVREGHSYPTPSCGAISSLYNSSYYPQDMDLRALKNFIDTFAFGNGQRDMGEITEELARASFNYMAHQLEELSRDEKIGVLYYGGIEIDTNKNQDEEDKILVLKKEFIKG